MTQSLTHTQTSPFMWYFLSALPRALSCSMFLVPIGLLLSPRTRQLVLPALMFVFIYSFLPHKELRFIIYVIPVCNVAAAEAMHKVWINRGKSSFQAMLCLVSVLHLLGNLATTGMFLYTSHNVHVHIDVAAAQTGITRFGQLYDNWRYNKTEDLAPGGVDMLSFTHIITGDPSHLPLYSNTHTTVAEVVSFNRVAFNRDKPPFLFWKHSPKMWILKRQ
ncbi:ALG12-like protein [Mya arenaria]|uniref:Mannosyltransferase n=1 Tax=Mya arenaria TaxID=6604 RepID=A0ABY7FWS6_MYAAR|nr:ALG12-like protein [Mya arenaria]